MAAALLSFILGTTSGTAKQAFDALVQRDAPDANRGRSFARFETRFQLAWVMGAFIPVVLSGIGVPITVEIGYFLIGVLMAIGLVSYYLGQRRVAAGTYDWESPTQKLIRKGLRRGDPDRGRGRGRARDRPHHRVRRRFAPTLAADGPVSSVTDRPAPAPAPAPHRHHRLAARPRRRRRLHRRSLRGSRRRGSCPVRSTPRPSSPACHRHRHRPSTAAPAPPAAPPPPLFDGEAVDAVDADPIDSVDATTVGSARVGAGSADDDHEQPTLPLDFGDPLVDPTVVDDPPPDDGTDTLFAEPRWRDSPR